MVERKLKVSKICKYCKGAFESDISRQAYCSYACKQSAKYRRHIDLYKAKSKIYRKRRQVLRTCLLCNKLVGRKKYCPEHRKETLKDLWKKHRILYKKRHPDKVREEKRKYQRERQKKCPEKLRGYQKIFYYRHRSIILIKHKEYRSTHKEERRAYDRNRGDRKGYYKKWKQKNREKYLISKAIYKRLGTTQVDDKIKEFIATLYQFNKEVLNATS